MMIDGKDMDNMRIDVNNLGVDWANQRAQINRRIEVKKVRTRRIRLAWVTGAAVSAAALLLLMWHQYFIAPYSDEMNDFMVEIEAISDDYVPTGLYVLNGYLDDKPDAEAMVEFIVPQYGEEDL